MSFSIIQSAPIPLVDSLALELMPQQIILINPKFVRLFMFPTIIRTSENGHFASKLEPQTPHDSVLTFYFATNSQIFQLTFPLDSSFFVFFFHSELREISAGAIT